VPFETRQLRQSGKIGETRQTILDLQPIFCSNTGIKADDNLSKYRRQVIPAVDDMNIIIARGAQFSAGHRRQTPANDPYSGWICLDCSLNILTALG
jgi:hypothetical protein